MKPSSLSASSETNYSMVLPVLVSLRRSCPLGSTQIYFDSRGTSTILPASNLSNVELTTGAGEAEQLLTAFALHRIEKDLETFLFVIRTKKDNA